MSGVRDTPRDEILTRLRRALDSGRSQFRGEPPAPPAPTPMTVVGASGDRPELARAFGTKLEALAGSYQIVGSADLGEAILAAVARETDLAPGLRCEVLSWAPSLLPGGLAEELARGGVDLVAPDNLHDEASRARAAAAAIGLTGVDAAFASTGSMALQAGPGKSRVASLLPLHHLALVPFDRLYQSLEAWLALLRRKGQLASLLRGSAQTVFVTGPSRTGDIEMNITLGVHGPANVHAILIDPNR